MMLTKLQQACKFGDYEKVAKSIFIDKEDVDGDCSYSPLYAACERGHMDIVRLLVSCGADVNKKYGRKQMTALHAACEDGDEGAVGNLLTIHGVDVNIKDRYGDAPIHSYLGFRNYINSPIFNMITGHIDFDWNCKDNRGYDFEQVVRECKAIQEKENNLSEEDEEDYNNYISSIQSVANTPLVTSLDPDREDTQEFKYDGVTKSEVVDILSVCWNEGCNNPLSPSWNECERCDACCTCVGKCPCRDRHCSGDCGTQSCGVCIDTCRCRGSRVEFRD